MWHKIKNAMWPPGRPRGQFTDIQLALSFSDEPMLVILENVNSKELANTFANEWCAHWTQWSKFWFVLVMGSYSVRRVPMHQAPLNLVNWPKTCFEF